MGWPMARALRGGHPFPPGRGPLDSESRAAASHVQMATTPSCSLTGELNPKWAWVVAHVACGLVGRSGAARTPGMPGDAGASPWSSQHFSEGQHLTSCARFERGVGNRCEGCSCMVHMGALGRMWRLSEVHGTCKSLHAWPQAMASPLASSPCDGVHESLIDQVTLSCHVPKGSRSCASCGGSHHVPAT